MDDRGGPESAARSGAISRARRLAEGWRAYLTGDCAIAVAGALIFGVAFGWPVLTHLTTASLRDDWDLFLLLHWVPYYTVTHFHQLPLWNPYECGGVPMIGNPQSRVLTPFFLIHLLFGPAAGIHLEIALHFALAWAGGYFLARTLKMSRIASAGAATIFPASSWLSLHVAVGHVIFLGFAYTPWFLAFLLQAADRKRIDWAVMAGGAIAMAFFEGSAHPVIYTAMLAVPVVVTLAVMERSWWPLGALAIAGIFGLGFAAPKLLAAIHVLSLHPRPVDYPVDSEYGKLLVLLFSPRPYLSGVPINHWGFWESGAYIGLFVIPALAGLLAGRRAVPWGVAAIFMLLLYGGDHGGSLWPWTILHHLPVFSSSQNPSRAIIPFVLAVAVLAGFGFDCVQRWMGSWGARAVGIFIVAAAVDCLMVDFPIFTQAFVLPIVIGDAAPTFVQFYRPLYEGVSLELELWDALKGRGSTDCYEYTSFPTPAVGSNQLGYRGEQYVVGTGSVELERWTPNKLWYRVDAAAPSFVVINQNYDPSWSLVRGAGVVFWENGLLGVQVPAGRQEIELVYRDREFAWGVLIFLATLAAAAFIFFFEWRQRVLHRER
ncbi:MAG TPA: hypothetical protein VEC38_15465 [Candidatus Binataceae bacterium]|nr:hypothetical protein [Candidatus Binataceae bacterium]